MSAELKVSLCILIFIALIYICRWFVRLPVKPDPWEVPDAYKNEMDSSLDVNEDQEGTPVCLKCLRPVDSRAQHYCPSCGNVTGEYTRYIPFLDIPFNYSIYSTLWTQLKSRKTNALLKLFNFFLILLTGPIMLIIGIPIWLFSKNPVDKARKLYEHGKLQEARKLAENAVSQEPDSGEALDTLGMVLYNQGNFADAAINLERAESIMPEDIEIKKHLAEVYQELGEKEKAEELRMKIIEIEQENAS